MHIVISLVLQFVFWFWNLLNLELERDVFLFLLAIVFRKYFGAINIIKKCSKINIEKKINR